MKLGKLISKAISCIDSYINPPTEKELKDSKETKDIIYYKYFIQHIKVKEISKDIAFAREYTYDLLKQIKSDIAKLEQELIKKNKKK